MDKKVKKQNWSKNLIIAAIVSLIFIGGIYLAHTVGPAIAKAHGM